MADCRWPVTLPGKNTLPKPVVDEIASIFAVLSDPTRIRILHLLLADGERPVSDLASRLGLGVAAASGQLRRMAALGVVERTARGSFAFYRVTDPCVSELLQRARCLAEDGKTRRRRRG